MKTKLEELEEKIATLKKLQNSCNHEWGEPFQDVMKEPIYEDARMGVDWYPRLVGYRDVRCWSRVCKKCDKKETTKKFGEIVVQTKMGPIF